VRRSYLTLAVVCTGWGTIPLVVRRVDLPAAAIVCSRVWLATLGLGAVIALDRRPATPLLSVRRGRVGLAGVVLAVHWLALFAAYRRAPVGTVVLIVYLAPVGIAATAPRLLGARIGVRTLVALAVAVGGFVLVTMPTLRRAALPGLGLAAIAAVLFVALVLLSKPLAEGYGGVRAAFQQLAVASVVLVPVAAATAWGPPRPAWALLLILGLVHTAAGTALYLGSLARMPATHTGILGYLEPASVLVCGWLFLGEQPAGMTWVGGALIVLAGAIVITSRASGAATPLEVPAVAAG
jgi:drug/metabolite transporter (DMT)-like permease